MNDFASHMKEESASNVCPPHRPSKAVDVALETTDGSPNPCSEFTLSITSLQRCFATDMTKQQMYNLIQVEFGGIQGLMNKLHTEATGLKADACAARSPSIEARIAVYGENTLPVAVPKTFLEFCQDVLQDTMLRVLFCAAIISVVLGCINHPTDGNMTAAHMRQPSPDLH
jgi:hypothetical protein